MPPPPLKIPARHAMENFRIHHEALARFMADILTAKGMSGADAATVAEVLAWANIRGVDGHGAVRLPTYLQFIDRGELDPRAEPSARAIGSTAFILDCARAAGPVALMKAARLAVDTARRYGVCIGLVRETTHTGAIGRYPQWVAGEGCACIMMNGGPPFMAYHGTRTAHLGTSPIAIAVPGGDGDPLDICVLSERAIARNEIIVRGRVIGGLQMIDAGEADDKIISVLENDYVWGGARNITEVPSVLVERLQHYFLTYKLVLGRRPQARIAKVYGRAHALKVVRAAMADYEDNFAL
jgi:inorganic pyrophosphatase